MRFLRIDDAGGLSLSNDLVENFPPYAILSHTWGADEDEVNFNDMNNGSGKGKPGYTKLQFCAEQSRKDGLHHFWVDTCCIDKANHTELSENITSMYRWYRDAVKCYVFLSDVSASDTETSQTQQSWKPAFRSSRWFTRGWTLQELLAPKSVEFFSREKVYLGNRDALEGDIHEITGIPILALRGKQLSLFSVEERMQWAVKRHTKKREDRAYCLLGIFNVFMPLIYGEGDNAFRRLQEAVGSPLKDPAPQRGNTHWMVTRSPNTFFTGRGDILLSLETTLRAYAQNGPRSEQCRIVITGIGGQGKSEICLQLAQRVRELFWGVFWVDVSTTSLAHNAFLGIAARLKIPADTWEEAKQGLANIDNPWLLVLDNADDLDTDYQDFFPPGQSGVVLLNSRNYECQQYATDATLSLDGLRTAEAVELLLKAARIPKSEHPKLQKHATEVAKLLQSHPLALIQAGTYVGRGHCELAQYLEVYRRHRKRLLTFRPSQARSRYRDVYATFEASLDLLKTLDTEEAEDALSLLPMLAVCAPRTIPLEMFEYAWTGTQKLRSQASNTDASGSDVVEVGWWHVSQFPPFMQVDAGEWDCFRLMEAVHILKSFALVSTDTLEGKTSVSMHPLVHAWARDRQTEAEQHQAWIKTGSIWVLSDLADSGSGVDYHLQLQPHIQAMTRWELSCIFGSERLAPIVSILVRCGEYFYLAEGVGSLAWLLDRLFEFARWDWLVVSEQFVLVYDLVARAYTACDEFKDAIVIAEQVVEIQKRRLAEDDSTLTSSQLRLAQAYRANGQVREAVALLERVVAVEARTLAEDSMALLLSQHELARAHQANGQIKEAIALLEHVVAVQKKTLAEDNVFRLLSQHELAGSFLAGDQLEQAIVLLEHVVAVEARKYPEDDESLLTSQHQLAIAYRANKQIEKAIALLEHTVAVKRQTSAEDDSVRLTLELDLAIAYWNNAKRKETALQMIEHVVEVRRRRFGKDHTDVLFSEELLEQARRGEETLESDRVETYYSNSVEGQSA